MRVVACLLLAKAPARGAGGAGYGRRALRAARGAGVSGGAPCNGG